MHDFIITKENAVTFLFYKVLFYLRTILNAILELRKNLIFLAFVKILIIVFVISACKNYWLIIKY